MSDDINSRPLQFFSSLTKRELWRVHRHRTETRCSGARPLSAHQPRRGRDALEVRLVDCPARSPLQLKPRDGRAKPWG